jgi:hypothetical protein
VHCQLAVGFRRRARRVEAAPETWESGQKDVR